MHEYLPTHMHYACATCLHIKTLDHMHTQQFHTHNSQLHTTYLIGSLHMNLVNRAGSVSEISPRHSFLRKNFDVFISVARLACYWDLGFCDQHPENFPIWTLQPGWRDEICFDKTAALLQHSGQNDIPVIEYWSDDGTTTKFMKLWNLLRYSESTWWRMLTCQKSASCCNLGVRYWPFYVSVTPHKSL